VAEEAHDLDRRACRACPSERKRKSTHWPGSPRGTPWRRRSVAVAQIFPVVTLSQALPATRESKSRCGEGERPEEEEEARRPAGAAGGGGANRRSLFADKPPREKVISVSAWRHLSQTWIDTTLGPFFRPISTALRPTRPSCDAQQTGIIKKPY
jgi:hypothetical protein